MVVQDFELWDDVGLNIPKPPDLLQIYRNCGSALPSPRNTVDVAVGVESGELTGNYITQKSDLLQQVREREEHSRCDHVCFEATQNVYIPV